MVIKEKKDVLSQDSSALLKQNQDHGELIRFAKECLERAERVLAESV